MTLSRRFVLAAAAAMPAAALVTRPAAARTPEVYANRGVAVDGSDVVAYFLERRPVAGQAAFTHDWRGSTWRFSSEANLAAFAADPEAFAPQYGGYCAWAVSNNYTAATVPEAWTIADGKLYLNFSRRIQRRWERDMAARIAAADRNWPAVLG